MGKQRKLLYLDYNATTPLDPRVLDAMMPWFLEPGNAGSRSHSYGQRAKAAVERAREQVAAVVGAKPEEIVFTSGATESNNLAILGMARNGESDGRRHIVSTAIEHKAVLEPLEHLKGRGFEVELAPVTRGGYVEPDAVLERVRADTLLVSVMHANNETGVLQPISEIGRALREKGVFFHTDAAQTFGKEVDGLRATPCDAISISGHKVYAPQGIGALCVRRRTEHRLASVAFGGGQERGLRPGTLPVALIVGLGVASDLAYKEHKDREARAAAIKDAFLRGLEGIDHHLNGEPGRTQSHVINISFPGVDSEALMVALKSTMAISNGSACTSSSYTPSHVLTAMGLEQEAIESSVRMSWGEGVAVIETMPLVDAVCELKAGAIR
ncbi:MAG: cysteine desulfurase DndA [Thermoguttaceae bacterium]|jgi:cysteine desulfurase|nr:cysteine desulfurase DndA [Thermoguttaceae bacterium]